MGLLYNYNSFSLRRTNKHPSSGPNLPLNLFFTEFMFFITLSRHSQKHNFSTFSSKIYSWTSLQFIFSPLNFFHRPVFRPVPRTLGNSHRVSNSHLTFSSVKITIDYFHILASWSVASAGRGVTLESVGSTSTSRGLFSSIGTSLVF